MNTNEIEELYVYVDFESTGLWTPIESGGFANIPRYDKLKLSEDLVRRFKYWTAWFDNRRVEIEDQQNQIDKELFRAYGLSLAIDLKREKEKYRVFYGHKGHADCVEIILVLRDYDGEYVPWLRRPELT